MLIEKFDKYKNLKKFLLAASPYWLVALVIILAGSIIIDIMTPSKPLNWTWNGVGMFVTVCAGLGWIFHGTGFLLVKVSR